MIYMFKVIDYFLQMDLKILEKNVLKDMNLILLIFYQLLEEQCKLVLKRQK